MLRVQIDAKPIHSIVSLIVMLMIPSAGANVLEKIRNALIVSFINLLITNILFKIAPVRQIVSMVVTTAKILFVLVRSVFIAYKYYSTNEYL